MCSSMIHKLKLTNPYFQDVWDKKKLFEVRKNDRGFQLKDILYLKEYDPVLKIYLPRTIIVQITYILDDLKYCVEGYVILGIHPIHNRKFRPYDLRFTTSVKKNCTKCQYGCELNGEIWTCTKFQNFVVGKDPTANLCRKFKVTLR